MFSWFIHFRQLLISCYNNWSFWHWDPFSFPLPIFPIDNLNLYDDCENTHCSSKLFAMIAFPFFANFFIYFWIFISFQNLCLHFWTYVYIFHYFLTSPKKASQYIFSPRQTWLEKRLASFFPGNPPPEPLPTPTWTAYQWDLLQSSHPATPLLPQILAYLFASLFSALHLCFDGIYPSVASGERICKYFV